MLRVSLLSVIVGFAFCSFRLYGLEIINRLKTLITVLRISEGRRKHFRLDFTDIGEGITIFPGEGITIENSAKSLYKNYDKGKSDTADFSNLIINVEYEGKQHTFETWLLSQNVRNGLKNNDRAVVFKRSRNKLKAPFDLLVQKKLHLKKNCFR